VLGDLVVDEHDVGELGGLLQSLLVLLTPHRGLAHFVLGCVVAAVTTSHDGRTTAADTVTSEGDLLFVFQQTLVVVFVARHVVQCVGVLIVIAPIPVSEAVLVVLFVGGRGGHAHLLLPLLLLSQFLHEALLQRNVQRVFV
jgi:hypothetical protein